MAFARVDLESGVQEDFALTISFTDTIAALDLTGASFDLTATGPGGATLTASTANGRFSVIDATGAASSGAFSLAGWRIPASIMAAMAPGLYRYSLTMAQGGQTFEIWTGALALTA